MTIYKLYIDLDIQTKTNSAAAFEDELMEQNGNTGKYFTSKEEAVAAYNAVTICPLSAAHHYVTTISAAEGKLLEAAVIDDEDYAAAIEDGDDLATIYRNADSWETILYEVSQPKEV